MNEIIEQRVCLKFCVANGISCADSLKMLEKAYGESVLSKTRAYEWYKAFKEGREIVEDMPRSGRPSTSSTDENIEKVKEIVLDNRHSSLREIARDLNISHESVRSILVDILGMRRVAARLVPKELNFLQKQYREQVSLDMLDRANSDPTFMERIITGDETWVYELLKLPLRGTRFDSIEAIKQNSWKELKAIPESAYKNCFEDWIALMFGIVIKYSATNLRKKDF